MNLPNRILVALLLLAVSARAQGLPQFTGAWVNGGPYSAAALEGKEVVLYFYEAG